MNAHTNTQVSSEFTQMATQKILLVETAEAQSDNQLRLKLESQNANLVDAFESSADLVSKIELLKPDVLLCLLYTSPSPRDLSTSRMPSSA